MKTIRMITEVAIWDGSFAASFNQELTLPDEKAAGIVGAGLAVYIDTAPEPVQEVPVPEQVEQPVEEPVVDEVHDESAEEAEPEDPDEPKRPYGNASKADWIHYALKVNKDLTVEAASDMSKVQLMSAYGERLLQVLPRERNRL